MAQTILGRSFKSVVGELSVDGTTWLPASGHLTSVELDGGDRGTEDTWTADTDTPIVSTGKRESIGVTMNCVYTEAANEPYALAKASYENDTNLYMRWSPLGGLTTQKRFAAVGKVNTAPYPIGEVGEAALMMVAVTIRTQAITESTI